jgi:DNA-binding beta-propeller fold protein YncE
MNHLLLATVLLFSGFAAQTAVAQETRYQPVTSFPQLPRGMSWGAVSGVATDSQGNVVVFHRGEKPVLFFSAEGSFLRSFGEGLIQSAHGLRMDQNDNVWITDVGNHTVNKFTPEGKLLLTRGEKYVAGTDSAHFDKPTDVAIAPNGDFYVTDGYGNSRVMKFDAKGNFLLTWGKKGTGAGEFNLPHAICLDAMGRVYVGDRENNRVQMFDARGNFLRQFGGVAPFGLHLHQDTLYVADGRAHQVVKFDRDGKLVEKWGSGGKAPGQFLMPHAITVDQLGAVYVTEITGARVQKFVAAP